MKRHLYFIIFFPLVCFAQVGINTSTPEQGVHVAGASSQLKIDALSSSNNSKNLGPDKSTRVFVNTNGDLVLANEVNTIELLLDAENYLADEPVTGGVNANDVLQTGIGEGYGRVGWPRLLGPGYSTFTLTRPAIVEINYSLSWGNVEKWTRDTPGRIGDGHARIVQSYMYLKSGGPDGPDVINDLDGIPLILIGHNGQFYTNKSSTAGERNSFHNSGSDYVKLPAGTYCPMFRARLAVSDTGGTGAVKMFWGLGKDEVQVVAHYYQK